jgi:NIPSNAP
LAYRVRAAQSGRPHYPYNDLQHRTRVRASLAQDPERNALPGGQDLIVGQEAEIVIPAPFMRPLGSRDYGSGNFYEMRIYTYAPGDLPKVLEAWAKVIESRERLSPLAACFTSELGGLNKTSISGPTKTWPNVLGCASNRGRRAAGGRRRAACGRAAKRTSC